MGEIRSAVEIALEKTANIHSDKSHVENREFKNIGKKAAGDFIESGRTDELEKVILGKKEENRVHIAEGAISILLASIHLPATDTDLVKMKRTGIGLEILVPNNGIGQLFDQLEQILKQYMSELDNLKKMLEQQFMPRLRAKQQELSKRYGQPIALDLSQESEYVVALSKNKRMIEQKYNSVIEEVRSRVRELAQIEN